jgi:hypothetical protein
MKLMQVAYTAAERLLLSGLESSEVEAGTQSRLTIDLR